MLGLDTVLMIAAMMFALSAQDLPGGVVDNFFKYLPVLPYMIVVGVGISIWLSVCSIRLNSYETAAIGMTAVFATMMVCVSIVLSRIGGLNLPLAVHLVFGAAFFSAIIARISSRASSLRGRGAGATSPWSSGEYGE